MVDPLGLEYFAPRENVQSAAIANAGIHVFDDGTVAVLGGTKTFDYQGDWESHKAWYAEWIKEQVGEYEKASEGKSGYGHATTLWEAMLGGEIGPDGYISHISESSNMVVVTNSDGSEMGYALDAANLIFATNLPKEPSKDIDPVSEQFHKNVNEFFLNLHLMLGLLNLGSKMVTGKNLQGNSYAAGDPLQAMGPGPIKAGKGGITCKSPFFESSYASYSRD